MTQIIERTMRFLGFFRKEISLLHCRYSSYCTQDQIRRKIKFGVNVEILGDPLYGLHENATITIGDRVMLNSRNEGYHVGMFSPVKLLADRPGACIEIGEETRIHGSCLHAWKSIRIGKRCLIAANCHIVDSNGHPTALQTPEERVKSTDVPRPVVIRDDVWIGTGCVVLPGVTIGRGSIIGAGSVVTKDIPVGVIAAGNPARTISSSNETPQVDSEFSDPGV